MCGIAGILRIYPPGITPPPLFDSIPEAWLDILDASIKHRGPDGQGRFRDRVTRPDGCTADVALVHRRLSILDHAGGAQPMLTPPPKGEVPSPRGGGGTTHTPLLFHGKPNDPVHYQPTTPEPNLLAVIFNGCIYNHRELRKELEAAGHRFHTDHSDTEVLLHGWRQWRTDLFARLDGMYACALWDRTRGSISIARDPFGEKPLYSRENAQSGLFAFASTLPALVRLDATFGSSTHTDARAWAKYGWNQTTPLERVRDLIVGECRSYPEAFGPSSAEAPHTHFNGWLHDVLRPERNPATAEQIDAVLSASVRARLEADVPLGCFLSGGVDSALIAHYARQSRPDITAFTVRMPSADYDESDQAAETARTLNVRHEILECDAQPAADLVAAIEQLGLPFGDSSLLPSIWVSRAARQRATVCLSGDGGDELFLGYDRYRAIKYLRWLDRSPKSMRTMLAAAVAGNSNPKSNRTRVARLFGAAAGEGFKELVAIFHFPLDQALGLTPGWTGHYGITPSGISGETPDSFDLARRFDLLFYLPCDLLRKADTASMSVALELRAPFLANNVARLGIHASQESLMPRGQRKGLLRQLARKHLPASIVDRPKMGFAIPIGDWFRTDYGGLKQLLLDHLNSADPFPSDLLGLELNRTFITQMVNEHMNQKRDHSQRLYMLLVLAIWSRWMKRLG